MLVTGLGGEHVLLGYQEQPPLEADALGPCYGPVVAAEQLNEDDLGGHH